MKSVDVLNERIFTRHLLLLGGRNMLFFVREAHMWKSCAKGLYAWPLVRRPTDITENKGTVVPNVDRPRPTRNVFIFDNGIALKGPKMS